MKHFMQQQLALDAKAVPALVNNTG